MRVVCDYKQWAILSQVLQPSLEAMHAVQRVDVGRSRVFQDLRLKVYSDPLGNKGKQSADFDGDKHTYL